MLFNSLEFPIFLVVVYVIYWGGVARSPRWRNLFLLAASYVFYGWWDPRFLLLVIASSFADYILSLKIERTDSEKSKRLFLLLSLGLNLGLLGVFKYYNFFVRSLASALEHAGIAANLPLLHVVLPVGISFYTFQTLSYTIDVYRKRMVPTADWLAFFAYVAFFPQLVAGPIERASTLLPQFQGESHFVVDESKDGLRQMLWGFFKKIVIADNAGRYVGTLFADPTHQPGSALAIGAVFFSFQIYGDFSGYSDIAIGTARLFGFRLMQNFDRPYFARDIPEFWRRWHISLTTWFRDYVYIPLGGSRVSAPRGLRNVLLVFLLSGLWHGANWTFVVWGALHAAYFLPSFLRRTHRRHTGEPGEGRIIPRGLELLRILSTFTIVSVTWVFFRADSLDAARVYLGRLFSPSFFSKPASSHMLGEWGVLFSLIGLMVAAEWVTRGKPHPLASMPKSTVTRWCIYQGLLLIIAFFGVFSETEFIYFQF